VDLNRCFGEYQDKIQASATKNLGYELKEHKPGYNEVYSKLLDARNQVKMEWLQNPSHMQII